MEAPLLSHAVFEAQQSCHSDRESYSSNRDSSSQKEESPLTQAQIQAFQEAFSMFDKVEVFWESVTHFQDGGGTIDAAELQKTLQECDIIVDGNDLMDILTTIDHDQNGEIDFEEFLNLMTNTDIFIQAVEGGHKDENNELVPYASVVRKRVVLFDALTEFLRKQALKGANEIISYYSGKYRKIARNYNVANKGT